MMTDRSMRMMQAEELHTAALCFPDVQLDLGAFRAVSKARRLLFHYLHARLPYCSPLLDVVIW